MKKEVAKMTAAVEEFLNWKKANKDKKDKKSSSKASSSKKKKSAQDEIDP